MQVINIENFIFGTAQLNFGGLYKSTYGMDSFLNTFTP